MSRLASRFLAFVAVMQVLGCAHQVLSTIPARPDSIVEVALDSAQGKFLVGFRERLFGHSTLPDTEHVLCAYGTISHDTAYVSFFRSTSQEATASFVKYMPCGSPDSTYFGRLQYLGTVHNHHGGVDCGWSLLDDRSFYFDPRAWIDMVICSTGLIYRTKKQ